MSSEGLAAVPPGADALQPTALEGVRTVPAARAYWRLVFFLLFLASLFLPLLDAGREKPLFFDPAYRLPQFNRFMALALFALSVDMIWGYTGLLSLGHGLYFGMGAYIVAWSLKLQKAAMDASEATDPRVDRYILSPGVMPDYMMQCRLDAVPDWIAPLIDIRLALALAIIIPTIFAFAFGWVVFKRRIKGVYFSLITQALVLAFFHLVSNQRPYTGGVDGQNTLAGLDLFGIDFDDAANGSKYMFRLVTGVLVVFAFLCYVLVRSKFGKILTAIRDNEFRVMALGYNSAMFKTFVFALSGLMAALAGALFVAANQTASPTFFSINDSIEVVIFVAVGGRGTLVGPILGALLVNWGKDYVNTAFSVWWPVVLGGLFVAVVLFLPEGIIGGVPRFFKFVRVWFKRRAGLSASWNLVRVGVGLLYWGLVIVLISLPAAVLLRVLLWFASGGAVELNVDRLRTWTILAAAAAALVGLAFCCAAPSESRARKFSAGAIVALGLAVVAGVLAATSPLEEARRLLTLGGFGELTATLLLSMGLIVAGVFLLFAFFLRGVAQCHRHEALAKSVKGFVILLVLFLAGNAFLNYTVELAKSPPVLGPFLDRLQFLVHPFIGPFLFVAKAAYVVGAILLPVWLLRLLYQTHETINRPPLTA
jgi:urea transport system permease protein